MPFAVPRSKVWCFYILLFLATGCTARAEPVVFQAGTYAVTRAQWYARAVQEGIFTPGAATLETAAVNLARGLFAAAVLDARGNAVSDDELRRYYAQVTLATGRDEARALLGSYRTDAERLRIGLLPTVALNRLSDIYMQWVSEQPLPDEAARWFLRRVATTGADMHRLAKEHGYTYARWILERGSVRLSDEALVPTNSARHQLATRLRDEIGSSPAGTLLPSPLRFPEGYFVVRVVARASERVEIEGVTIGSPDFLMWMRHEGRTIPVWAERVFADALAHEAWVAELLRELPR